jgi:hypothetical protein
MNQKYFGELKEIILVAIKEAQAGEVNDNDNAESTAECILRKGYTKNIKGATMAEIDIRVYGIVKDERIKDDIVDELEAICTKYRFLLGIPLGVSIR